MQHSLKGKCAIVGVGETLVGRLPDKSARDLHVDAIRLALEDAGLTLKDVDGIMTPDLRVDPYWCKASVLAEYLGMEPSVVLSWPWGGMMGHSAILFAAAAISSGLCNTVVVASADNQLSSQGKLRQKVSMERGGAHPDFEWPYGPNIPAVYALSAQRHMFEYGTTSEQLAEVAVTFRNHAMRHPKAQKRTPITIQDVLASRMIASPLHLLDCSLVSDGGWALVITSAEAAKSMKQKPVYILGGAEAHDHTHITYAPNLTRTAAVQTGKMALQMAGIKPKDMNVLGLYDSFTITVLIQLEDLGFCEKGEAGHFVQGGRLGIGGELPTNTHGGLLSFAHAGRTVGFPHIVEMVLQLRGQANGRQVPNAKLGLVHGVGGMYAVHCTIIFGT